MPLNIPVGLNDNISFGPARVAMVPFTGASGSTPSFATDDVGFIGEDGVTLELMSEKKDISQGNPALVNFSFVQTQSATISFTSIQWDFDNFRLALGAGSTGGDGTGGDPYRFAFGGNPLNTFVCMELEHQMAVTGDTLSVLVWKAQSESGFSVPFGQDEHQFEFSFKAIRAINDWGGTPLSFDEQLLRFERVSGVDQYA